MIVTGASRGIGRAIAERLLAEGHDVIGLARSFANPRTHLQVDGGGTFQAIDIDLESGRDLPKKLEAIRSEVGDVDTLVFAAGRGEFGHLEQFSYESIRSLVELNFLSAAIATRAFLPTLKKQGQGDVIFIGSEAALAGKRKGSVYCASKFALRGFAQALREECATSGVRVTIIEPGPVKTGFFDELDFEPGDAEENYLRPEDVADAVALVVDAPSGTVYDEIVMSPLKRVLKFRKTGGETGLRRIEHKETKETKVGRKDREK
ncbi:MAG: SDR family oxidoreductase [Planctomycetota bacterium]